MHRIVCIAFLVLACAEADTRAGADSGAACDGGVVGPLGNCLEDDGSTDAGGACSSGSCANGVSCCGGAHCVPPGAPPVCGICFPEESECVQDTDCQQGHLCVPGPPHPCACNPKEISRCVPPCLDDTECGERERCKQARCVRVRCNEGPECPAFSVCDPTNFDADEHGCVHVTCNRSSDCDGGFCVGARCFEEPGACELPRP